MAHAYRYLVVIERSATGFGAWVPDLPGCVAVGDTLDETVQLMRGAIQFHLDGMREDGLPIPEPSSVSTVIEVEAA